MSIDVFPATVLNSTLWNGQTYEEGSFVMTATGFTTVVTNTVVYRRIGQLVVLRLPVFSGTSNATTFTLTGLPTALQTFNEVRVPVIVADNGVYATAPGWYALTGASSTITVYRDGPATAWTASGTKVSQMAQLVYPIASALSAPGWTGQTYEEGTFTVTATGFATTVTGTATYVKTGKQVTVLMPVMNGTSNATTFTLTGIPATIYGTGGQVPVRAQDNSIFVHGYVGISASSSTWNMINGLANSPWTASGIKSLQPSVLTYIAAA